MVGVQDISVHSLLVTVVLTLLFQMCKLKLEVFAIQDKSRLDLSVFVCLQKKIVGKYCN